MSEPVAAAPTWPLARGEHPDLPRLHIELHEGRPAVAGRKATTAIPPHARILFSPTNVIDTGSPDRLRHYARQLDEAADALEHEHKLFGAYTGQLPLDQAAK